MKKNIINLIVVFILGGFGGVFFSDIIVPKLPWSNVSWIEKAKDRTIIINKTEEVLIEESKATSKLIEESSRYIVTIKSFIDDRIISSGAGFVVSSDGLILTRREVVSQGEGKISVDLGGDVFSAEIFKRLDDFGLVLLKSDAINVPVVSFSEDKGNSLLGKKVFLLGNKNTELGNSLFINSGIIKFVNENTAETTIQEDVVLASGTPLLSVDGKVIGINFTNSEGYVFSVLASIIQDFMY